VYNTHRFFRVIGLWPMIKQGTGCYACVLSSKLDTRYFLTLQ